MRSPKKRILCLWAVCLLLTGCRAAVIGDVSSALSRAETARAAVSAAASYSGSSSSQNASEAASSLASAVSSKTASKTTSQTASTAPPSSAAPVQQEPQKQVFTLLVTCTQAVEKGMAQDPQFEAVVPANGVILGAMSVEFTQGETLFALTARTLKQQKIHMEYSGGVGGEYIQGIHNLYEYDGGNTSGWVYTVNGQRKSIGCGQYVVQPGDRIEWLYTTGE